MIYKLLLKIHYEENVWIFTFVTRLLNSIGMNGQPESSIQLVIQERETVAMKEIWLL